MSHGPTIPVFAYHPGGNAEVWIAYHTIQSDIPGERPIKVAMAYDQAEADQIVSHINTNQRMPDGEAVKSMSL